MCCLWFWNILDANKLISNMSHKANGLIITIVAETEESYYRSAVIKRRENCVFSVLREAIRNGRTFVT
jgi:hypothetical protein